MATLTAVKPWEACATESAEAYDAMAHTPDDPRVADSYRALRIAIYQQWLDMRRSITVVMQDDDPYSNSAEMVADVTKRHILRVYADHGETLPADHPMNFYDPTGLFHVNDIFRAVHDFWGHVLAPFVSFGPRGEWEAWRQHRRTLPEAAWLALWCETRGQNTWTNFYADHASLPLPERPYAAQKAGVVSQSITHADLS